MAWWARILDFMGFEVGEEEAAAEEESAAYGGRSGEARAAARAEVRRAGGEPRAVPGRRAARAGALVPLPVAEARPTRLGVFRPRLFDDVQPIADELKGGRVCVVNLEASEPEASRRILNFLSGIVYAVEGEIFRIGPTVFLLTPASAEVVGQAEPWVPER
ncbi:MAG: cell division protein SepF [Clostridia bacterium]|nr:cell division protein SepF [Clostridia bacterium]MCL6521992.1 cell division protein SepF [Bacillota bacterium]